MAYVGARPGQPFPKHVLDAITHVEEVDEFDGYPDKWIGEVARHLRAQGPAAVPRHRPWCVAAAPTPMGRASDDPGALEPCAARRLRLGAAHPLGSPPAMA
jgi:hypothetical protein